MAVACQIFDLPWIIFSYLIDKDEIHFDLLRRLEANPKYTQRELSKELGVSLGKVNYCIKKLTEKGLIKLMNFSRNPNKVGYAYLLTPKGIEAKGKLTISFLKYKMEEYELLKSEIEQLQQEADQ
jgi:EPS-associated MarR family transcriptional regulator